MRHQFHRCSHLRVLSLDASEMSGRRKGGSTVLEELCDARNLARCVGIAECDILSQAEKRELLGARVTRMRDEEGGASALAEVGGERGRELEALFRELLAEREEIVAENQQLLAEATEASEAWADAPLGDEEDVAYAGLSLRISGGPPALRAARLDAIDRALDAAAGASYGVCARCGAFIAVDRLRRAPDTRVCGKCASESTVVVRSS
jgi:RNA polymerase-binding transcription factor DksA